MLIIGFPWQIWVFNGDYWVLLAIIIFNNDYRFSMAIIGF